MTDKLYVIVFDTNFIEQDENEKFWKELNIFTNLDDALLELKNLYNTICEFKFVNYHIKVYIKNNNKYLLSNEIHYFNK